MYQIGLTRHILNEARSRPASPFAFVIRNAVIPASVGPKPPRIANIRNEGVGPSSINGPGLEVATRYAYNTHEIAKANSTYSPKEFFFVVISEFIIIPLFEQNHIDVEL